MTMQPYELDAWLGDTELTEDQRAAFERMIDMIAARYPGRDHGQHPDEDAMGEAMNGALMVLVGDATVEGLAQEWSRARVAERDAMGRLTGAVIATADAGVAETVIAERSGLNRRSVRLALGK